LSALTLHSWADGDFGATDLRNAVQGLKNDLETEKKRNNELADLLHDKTKQCTKIQVASLKRAES